MKKGKRVETVVSNRIFAAVNVTRNYRSLSPGYQDLNSSTVEFQRPYSPMVNNFLRPCGSSPHSFFRFFLLTIDPMRLYEFLRECQFLFYKIGTLKYRVMYRFPGDSPSVSFPLALTAAAPRTGKSPIDRSNHVARNFANYSGVIWFARKKVPARRGVARVIRPIDQ